VWTALKSLYLVAICLDPQIMMLDLANTTYNSKLMWIHECLKTHLSPFHPLWSKQVVLTGCADWTCYGFSTLECVTEVWEAFRCHWDCTLSLFSYENGSIKRSYLYLSLTFLGTTAGPSIAVSSMDSCHSSESFMFMREHSLAFYVSIFWPLCSPLRVYAKLA